MFTIFKFFYIINWFTDFPFTYSMYPLKSILLLSLISLIKLETWQSLVNFIFDVLSDFKFILLAILELFILK